ADPNLDSAHIIWEASGQEPAFGGLSYTFNPGTQTGPAWIEAEVQWPDGRRAFATNSVMVTTVAPPIMVNVRPLANGGVGFSIAGTPFAKYVIQVSTDLQSWSPISTNTVSSSGLLGFSDPQAGVASPRFYRAVRSQ
ncbi:MAG TPA: hypothetical protein VKY92_13760, partial [Verrucomicrobiae bacterium]|nr:hypothetical protein [Verrucomicrobiae bacterium]